MSSPAAVTVCAVHQQAAARFSLLRSPQHGRVQAVRLGTVRVPDRQVVVRHLAALVLVGQLAGAVQDAQVIAMLREQPLRGWPASQVLQVQQCECTDALEQPLAAKLSLSHTSPSRQ